MIENGILLACVVAFFLLPGAAASAGAVDIDVEIPYEIPGAAEMIEQA